jgi:hypothetical protein
LKCYLLPHSGMGLFHIFLLLNLISLLLGNPQISNCDLCMHTIQVGSIVTRTLLFHTYYSCAGTVIGSCTHNHTIYSVCSHGNQHICLLQPHLQPSGAMTGSLKLSQQLINHIRVSDSNKPVPINFDVCATIAKNTTMWGHCGSLAWERT